MNSGFTIELINNNNNAEREINLFTNEGLPDDVTLYVINTKNNYDFSFSNNGGSCNPVFPLSSLKSSTSNAIFESWSARLLNSRYT